MSEDQTGQEPSRPGRVLSNRAIAVSALAVVLIAGAAGWLLLRLYGGGTPADRVRLEAIRTVGAVVLGAGGAIALLLAARRQRTAEQDLVETRRDLAHRERVQRHAERVAADNHAHQQRVAEAAERDAPERRITELYTRAAEQLGSDKAPVRLAGLYALERLAQDNPTQRLTVTNLVCAYLRMPYLPPGKPPEPDAGGAASDEYRELVQEREVRLTAQTILQDHFRVHRSGSADSPDTYWGPLAIDLTGATLVNFNLSYCRVGVGKFMRARFVEATHFRESDFSGWANFAGARFDNWVIFDKARFAGEAVFFDATFRAEALFIGIEFGRAAFDRAEFNGETMFKDVRFRRAEFDKVRFGAAADFTGAQFEVGSSSDAFPPFVSFAGTTFARGVPPEVSPHLSTVDE